ncbi:MAG: GWxTD domain-containing protein [candidate division Zixibacteria bacterium]|nr:GWxTD domain-containing protein [candidate division Zixibacteria bacterium]
MLILRVIFISLCAAFGLTTIHSNLNAQVEIDISRLTQKPGFSVDYASFYSPESGKTRLEVYYRIHNRQLKFTKSKDAYLASYEVRVLLSKKGKQIAGGSKEEQYPVASDIETLSPYDFIINQIIVEVEPGKYDCQVTMLDKLSQQVHRLDIPVKVKDYPAGSISLSDLELAQAIEDGTTGSQFNKFGYTIVPRADSVLCEECDTLEVYLELYSPQGKQFYLTYRIKNELNVPVLSQNDSIHTATPVTPIVQSMDISSLSPGTYALEVSIAAEQNGKPINQSKRKFDLDWGTEFYLEKDFNRAIELLRYIANGEETKALKNTPPDQRLKAWEDFWKSKDATPETPENEIQAEYYRRMRYSNKNFTSWAKPGWKTDFGMVYIRYGDPDEIDRHPFDPDVGSFEIWYYYPTRRVFTFVDDGHGEYRLQYPYDGDVYHQLR